MKILHGARLYYVLGRPIRAMMTGKTDGLLTAGITMSCRTYINTSVQYPKPFSPLLGDNGKSLLSKSSKTRHYQKLQFHIKTMPCPDFVPVIIWL